MRATNGYIQYIVYISDFGIGKMANENRKLKLLVESEIRLKDLVNSEKPEENIYLTDEEIRHIQEIINYNKELEKIRQKGRIISKDCCSCENCLMESEYYNPIADEHEQIFKCKIFQEIINFDKMPINCSKYKLEI